MRETQFIQQNEEKWLAFEEMLRSGNLDPERLNDLYIQITDDLSYARTFYPNRSVRFYLNGLAQRIFHHIYRGRQFPRDRFRKFWTDDVPQVMWESRKSLLLSFVIFMIAMLIGVVSSRIDPDFARNILGDSYVEMTLRNISSGDPMAVYKEKNAFGMSLGIAFNNIFVAMLTALFGVLAGIGTVFLLLSNGVMVGVFQYFFVEKGLFWESFLTIWIHGTLEISAIVIAGAAGLTAGAGLLFPGTYTRLQSFQLSVRRGIKIFIGLIPVFILAAFFEGFLTRFTETPDFIRVLFILTSLFFVLWYFVWLPREKARHGFFDAPSEQELPPNQNLNLAFYTIKTSGQIISDTIKLLRQNPKPMLLGVFSASILFMIFLQQTAPNGIVGTVNTGNGGIDLLSSIRYFFVNTDLEQLAVLQIFILSALSFLSIRSIEMMLPPSKTTLQNRSIRLGQTIKMAAPATLLLFIMHIPEAYLLWAALMLCLPLLGLFGYIIYKEKNNIFSSFYRTFYLTQWKTMAWIGVVLTSTILLFFLFLDSQIFRIWIEFLSWNVIPGEQHVQHFSVIVMTFIGAFLCYGMWWLMMVVGAVQYFSYREIKDATGLLEQIEEVGNSRQIRGLARE